MFFSRFPKIPFPDQLHICITAYMFPILSRASKHGFWWPVVRELARLKHKVTVITGPHPMGKEQPELLKDGVQVFFMVQKARTSKKVDKNEFAQLVYEKFCDLHRREPFHLVHSIDNSAYLIGKRSRELKVVMAYDVEASHMSEIFSILAMTRETSLSLLFTYIAVVYKFMSTYYSKDRPLLSSADGMFVTSPQQRVVLERHYMYPDYHIYTVPYGMEMGELSIREEDRLALWNRLQLHDKSEVVVTITDMMDFREIRNLLYAFEEVAVKKPRARLIIVGEGPLWSKVEYQVLQLALGNRVLMTGAVKNVELAKYISLANVFVDMSSRSSGFGSALISAMGQAKVIVGSELSPIAGIVQHGENGFLLRPADYASLGKLLLQIFSQKIDTEKVGKNAKKKIMNLFDITQMVNLTLHAYYRIMMKARFYLPREK